MTQAFKVTMAVLPSRQLRPQSAPYVPQTTSSRSRRTLARGSQASWAGRARDWHREACCSVNQGQHAHAEQHTPNISLLDPALQKEWDHAANAGLRDIDIRPYSGRKVYWLCDQCPDGHLHRWLATVYSRTRGSGCPQCCGVAVCKHNSLATKAASVAAQWDYEANDGTPDDVTAKSNKFVHWLCAVCGCKWKATPSARVRKARTGCPDCARAKARTQARTRHPTFAECQHVLLAEWDHQRNEVKGNFPHNIRLRSGRKIFWLCTRCPAGQQHSWSARPADRTGRSKSGCPCCAGQTACKCNSLQALYPEIAAEWDYSKNASQPSDYAAKSNQVVWWVSCRRGSWQHTIAARTKHWSLYQAQESCVGASALRSRQPQSPGVLGWRLAKLPATCLKMKRRSRVAA